MNEVTTNIEDRDREHEQAENLNTELSGSQEAGVVNEASDVKNAGSLSESVECIENSAINDQSSEDSIDLATTHEDQGLINEKELAETPGEEPGDEQSATGDADDDADNADNGESLNNTASNESQEGVEPTDAIVVDRQVDQPLIEPLSASEARHIQSLDEDEVADQELVPAVLDMPPTELRGVIEALLLVSNKPLKIERIEKCLPGSCKNYLNGFLRGLSERYGREQRGWDLRSVGGGWQLLTRVQFHPWVRQLDKRELPTRLSKSAMETLAIVAYKQPVSRGRIEDIRGVQCGPMLRQLMDMHLILVTGRDEDALGRPLLYGTTEQFLERFGLSAAEDLPRQHEFGS